jgi:single-strand DNA-binding protein
MSNYTLTGKVKAILDEQTFASGFNKREFVVTNSEGKFPQDIKFETVKDKTALVAPLKVGDSVTVSFDLEGSEWNGKFFVNLRAWKIDAQGQAQPAYAGGHQENALDEDLEPLF